LTPTELGLREHLVKLKHLHAHAQQLEPLACVDWWMVDNGNGTVDNQIVEKILSLRHDGRAYKTENIR
jgi:hypothetical protein